MQQAKLKSFLDALDTQIIEHSNRLSETRQILDSLMALRENFTQSGIPGDLPGPYSDMKPRGGRNGHADAKAKAKPPRDSKRLRIRQVTTRILQGQTKPVPIEKILEELADQGVEVGGSVPARYLSVILSTDPSFRSVGRRGWVMASGRQGFERLSGELALMAR